MALEDLVGIGRHPDLDVLTELVGRRIGLDDVRQHPHRRQIRDRNGAGALPGCVSNPGAALRATILPEIGLGTSSVESTLRCRQDLIDLGVGLAEDAHRILVRP